MLNCTGDILIFFFFKNYYTVHKGRTIRKVMGGGGGEILACTNFFSLFAWAGIFFAGETLCTSLPSSLHEFFFLVFSLA